MGVYLDLMFLLAFTYGIHAFMELQNKFESQTFQIFFCFVLYKAERLIVETYFNLVATYLMHSLYLYKIYQMIY